MPEHRKNQLLRHDDRIIRVLAVDTDVLTIDCLKRTMPQWMPASALCDWEPCDESALPSPEAPICNVEDLTAEQRKLMHERYTLIAPVLPFIHKEAQRSAMIAQMAELNNVSKQTNLSLDEVMELQAQQQAAKKSAQPQKDQALIDLVASIETIANTRGHSGDVNLKGIRQTHKTEKQRRRSKQ